MAHAVTDLVRDACGTVIPSLCGTRESRLAAALGRASSNGIRSHGEVIAGIQFNEVEDDSSGEVNRDGQVNGGGISDDGGGVIENGDGEERDGGGGGSDGEVSGGGNTDLESDTGNAVAVVVVETKDRIEEGHELNQYFFL